MDVIMRAPGTSACGISWGSKKSNARKGIKTSIEAGTDTSQCAMCPKRATPVRALRPPHERLVVRRANDYVQKEQRP